MILKFVGDIPEDICFSIFVDGKSKQLDAFDKEAVFDLSETRSYRIRITQEKSFNNHTVLMIILFVITAVLQGIVNILLMTVESKWYKNITPFLISKDFNVFISSDQTINLKYKIAHFDDKRYCFSRPVLYCDNVVQDNCVYSSNYIDFYNQYFSYVKRVISVGVICEVILFILLLISLYNYIYVAVLVCSFVLMSLVALQLFLIIKEYKFLNVLINTHKKQI